MRYLRGVLGGVVGGGIGVVIYWVLLTRHIHAPILVPGLVGLGCGLAYAKRSLWMGLISAGMALVITLVTDVVWYVSNTDGGKAMDYLRNLHRVDPIFVMGVRIPLLVVYAIGIGLAFWFGLGRDYLASGRARAPASEPRDLDVEDTVEQPPEERPDAKAE